MGNIYNQDPVSWALWTICLGVGLVCLIPNKGVDVSLKWASPKIAFGFAFILFHVLRPFYLMLTGDYYGTRIGFYSFSSFLEMNLMLLASALGGSAFLIGWRWDMRKWERRSNPKGSEQTPKSVNLLLKRVFVLLPVAVVAFVWGSRENLSSEFINLYYLLRSSLIAITYLFGVASIYSKTSTRYLFYLTMAAIFALGFLWLFLQESGSSRLFLFMFMVPGFIILSFQFKRKALVLIAVLAVFSVLVFRFLGYERYALREGVSPIEQLRTQTSKGKEGVPSYLFQSGDFEAFEKGMLLIQLIPEYESPYWGGSFATLVVMPIPRMLWPEKPKVSPNDILMKWYPMIGENFAVTLIGEAYANWLWPGVVLVLFLFGLISARLYQHTLSAQFDAESWVLLGLYIAYIIMVMRGSFHTMTSYYLFCLFWFVASKRVVRFGQRRRPKFASEGGAFQ